MDILYLSVLSSNRILNDLYHRSGCDPGFAIQKFNRLMAKGLQDNNIDVTILSALPVRRQLSSKIFWNVKSEKEDGLTYRYLPFLNLPVIRQLCLYSAAFIKVLIWLFLNSREKVVICDVLNTSICMAALHACSLLRKPVVGFVTDMPGLMVGQESVPSLRNKVTTLIRKSYLSSFDKYIFLTEAANHVVNKHCKPFVIMEGISDSHMVDLTRKKRHRQKRTIMYAGGVFAKYGVETLVKAVTHLNPETCELVIYGSGSFVDELKQYCNTYSHIRYMGVALTSEVVQAELEADLLVNPRPTDEVFTKYSFPSKNIEYMASGTPLLTTKLPGMPTDYYPYVFLIENESTEGYAHALRQVLQLSDEALYDFGEKAKYYVLENKNGKKQGERVSNLLK